MSTCQPDPGRQESRIASGAPPLHRADPLDLIGPGPPMIPSTSDEPSFPAEPADEANAQDLRWMAEIKNGDTGALQALIECHQHRIIGTVAKMLGDESDAEDIAQQVFIRVWKNAGRYEPTAKFTTWLYKITRNLVFNELRRRKRHPAQSLDRPFDADDERPLQAPDPHAKTPDRTLLDDEMQAAIQSAIDELPETQRLAVILRRYDDISYEEIGEILDLTVPAVKSVLFRARTELREKLRKYLEA
jgi:RNA polymerase sigma-70 factor (ECF subfamily)